MFAIEIAFSDGVSQPETILVRRPQFIVGGSDYAHVAIEDMRELKYQIRVIRDLGRRFRTKIAMISSETAEVPQGLEGSFDGSALFNLGRVRLCVTALDVDLSFREAETPDRAGVRILRHASSSLSPDFPAVVVRGGTPMVVSFSPDQPIYVGRLNQCAVRLDSADVSGRHARIGFEGMQFWVEDLGSTNGTFVDGQQISGRVNLQSGTEIVIGREASLVGVSNEDELVAATRGVSEVPRAQASERRFPVLVSVSEMARPARLVMVPGAAVSIGRDPTCEMWIGAPHISRKHCTLRMGPEGSLSVTDSSTNGTGHDGGILHQGETMVVQDDAKVLDFGGGVTVGLCFDEAQEQKFRAAKGSPHSFVDRNQISPATDDTNWSPVATGGTRGLTANDLRKPRWYILATLKELFMGASPFGKLTMLFLAVAALVVVGVIVNLLLGVVFR